MNAAERKFALFLSSSHGLQHFLRRMFPPLIPIWVVSFDFSLAMAGLILSAQPVGSAIGQTPFGILSDRRDRRYLMPAGIAFSSLSVVAFGIVPFLSVFQMDLTFLGVTVEARLLVMFLASFGVGFGGSVVHPTGYPLISENVAEERKGRVLGLWGSGAKLGDGLAPAVVGLLLLSMAWTSILIVLGAFVLGYTVLLFVALGRYETRPVAMQENAGLEDAGDGVGVPLTDLDRRVYVYPMLAVFAFFAIRMLAAGGVNTFIPQFVTSEYGYSIELAGAMVTPESTASFYYSALLIVAGLVQVGVGRLVDEYDARTVILSMLLVATVLIAMLAVLSLGPFFLLAVLLGLGASMWGMAPARDRLVSRITPADREGRTFGYLWTGALLVAALSPVLIGYIGDTAGLRTAFVFLAASTLLSAIPIVLLFSDVVYKDTSDRDLSTGAGDD